MLSCVSIQPQLLDIPLIEEKNDLRVDGSVSLVKGSVSGNVAYGITDELAVQLGGNVATLTSGRHDYGQMAVGYYRNIRHNLLFEIYGGAGYGHGYTQNAAPQFDERFKGNYQKLFTQLNIGGLGEHLEGGFGLKGGFMQSSFSYGGFENRGNYVRLTEQIIRDNYMLIEPTAVLKFGLKNFKFNVKVGGLFMKNLDNQSRGIPYSPFNIGGGISLDL
tara:strand:+ start:167466 stop:168119 length:654 start_codon:yes stop_codon:yes gene_type:complete